MRVALLIFVMLFTSACLKPPYSHGKTCQQKLSRAGMDGERAYYYCSARGR